MRGHGCARPSGTDMHTLCRLIAALLLMAAQTSSVAAGEYRPLSVGDEARRYYLHLPADLPADPAPLVLVLHGAGGTGEQAVVNYGWQAKADEAGFVVAGPEALPVRPDRRAGFLLNPNVWNDGSGRGPATTQARDDVAYIATVIAEIAALHAIDQERIFVTGFSNGASMTQRFGAERSDLIAAIAPYAGAFWPPDEGLQRGLPVLYLTGDVDPLNPIEGGEISLPWGNSSTKPPVRASLDTWADWLGCAPGTTPARGPVAAVSLLRWSGCRGDGALTYLEVAGVGHHWSGFGDSGLPERWVGPYIETGFDVTEYIWRFFTAAPANTR